MTKGQEITQAWRKASTEQGHRPGTYQYDADLATHIDAAIAEAREDEHTNATAWERLLYCEREQHIDTMALAIAEEREECARVADCYMGRNRSEIARRIRARGKR